MRRFAIISLLVAAMIAAGGGSALAQWNQNASTGPFLYTDTANWVGGTIDNTFSTNPTTGLVVNWDADYTMSGALNLSYTGNQDISFQSDGATARTIKMAGDWTRGGGGTVTVGTLTNPLVLDLDGATRTFGGSTASYVINAAIVNTGSTAAGITLNAGSVTLSASNSFTGGTTLSSGSLVVGHTNALGASAGAVTVNGGTLDLGGLTSTRTGAVTLAGGLVQNGTLASNSVAFDVRSGTAAAVLGGSAGLSKTTSGTFTITGAATYGGSTTISAGRLNLSGGNNRLPTATSLTISGGTLDVGSTSQSIANFTATGGTIQGSGTLSVTAASGGVRNVTMSNLARFSYDGGTGTIKFGGQNTGESGTVYLAGTSNYVRAGAVYVPHLSTSSGGFTGGTLYFGGANSLNANDIFVGWTVRGSGNASFAPGLTNPTLTIRSQNGTGRANINIGWPRNSGYTTSGNLDTSAGSLDALVGTLIIGRGGDSTGFGIGVGTFTMATGTLDATTIFLGQSVNQANGDGTMQVSGGTVVVDTFNVGFRGSTGPSTGKFTLQSNGVLRATTITPSAGASTTFTWNSGTVGNKSGGNLTINSGFSTFNLATSGSHVFSIDSGRTGSVATNMSGAGRLTKAGAGLLTLSGSNSYSGGTTLVDGTLRLGHSSALGSTSGTIAIDGGTLDLFGQSLTVGALSGSSGGLITTSTTGAVTLTVNLSGTTTYDGRITGGSGTLDLVKGGAGRLVLSNSNAYGAGTTLNAGTIELDHVNALGTGTVSFAANATALMGVSGTVANPFSLATAVSGTFDTAGQNVTLSGLVDGAGGLTKTGAGRLALSNADTFSGSTSVSSGTLAIEGAGSIASSAGLAVASGATFDIASASGVVNVNAISGSGSVVLGGNTLRTVVGSGDTIFDGVISGSGGFTKAGADRLDLTSLQTFTGTATVESGNLLLAAGNALASASRINVAAGASIETYQNQVLTIVNNQTIGGYGTVYGPVAFNSGGILSPGGSVGTLTNDGSTTWNAGTIYMFEINSASGTAGASAGGWDLYTVTGTLTLAGSVANPITIDLTSLAAADPGLAADFNADFTYAWKFVVANAPITTYNATWFTVDSSGFQNLSTNPERFYVARGDQLPTGYSAGTTSELYVVYAAVPEPSTLVLAGIGVAIAAAVSRRRRGSPPPQP